MTLATGREQREKVLLFIHGVRNDDPEAGWRAALDSALLREGTEPLEARGYTIVAPSYLQELEADPPPKTDAPPMTYVKGPDDEYQKAAGRYWSRLADLERTGIRGHVDQRGLAEAFPAGFAAEALMPRLFEDATDYCKSADRRNAIAERILSEVPSDADLVVIGYSLGSVVAADLMYLWPRDCTVLMLITIGSPLGLSALQRHLSRRRNRFPYEVTGPWINVAGTRDPVTGFRGLSTVFPEALDVFVHTDSDPRRAHAARAYLDGTTVARALELLEQRTANHGNGSQRPRNLPDLLVPEGMLSVVAGAQYALRLEQALKPGEPRNRFGEARRLICEMLAHQLADAGQTHLVLQRLTYDNASFLRDRIEPQAAIDLLLAAWKMNPLAPYEIDVSSEVRIHALENLALDVGFTSDWGETVAEAEKEARDPHRAGWTWKRTAFVVAGAAAILAAPMLVIAAAPAGLAGGAAIVAGLAALGPGGMLGGVGIVGLVGGAGGAIAAQALISGSAAEVEETVIYLQARAKARRELRQELPGSPEWWALVAMEDAVTDEHARLKLLSDEGAARVKALEQKLASVRKALDWLANNGLAPGMLGPGSDGEP